MSTSYDRIIDKAFDGFKKLTPALIAVAIMSGLVLFLPETILRKVGLMNLPNTTTIIIGLLFLLSCTLILTILVSKIGKSVYTKVKSKTQRAQMRKKHKNLSDRHKEILLKLLSTENKSKEMNIASGDIQYLQANGFIYIPTQAIDAFNATYNMYIYVPHPWLVEYFEECPEEFYTESQKNNRTV
ncbi:MAG: superinfection exclusion B family protein [Clostridia bacterium]|nr:superinfection exclusion B family protein [Clostridia bacterium]